MTTKVSHEQLAELVAEKLAQYDKELGDLTVDEFAETMDESGFARRDDVIGAATGNDDADYEAFGTGMQVIPGTESTFKASEEVLATVRKNMENSAESIDDYGTGVQGEEETTARERQAAARRRELTAEEDADDLERFGTGIQGDDSGAKYREREEDIEKMPEAFSRAMDDEN